MKISIAMATYNGAQYLQEQLRSLASQTHLPDELIITDDCSADETETIVQEFIKTAPFTVEFHRNKRNLGYCGNFNAALMRTTGDLVFLSDQDDVWFPEKIEHMLGIAERYPEALVVMNNSALTDEGLNELGLSKIGQIRSAGFSMDHFMMGCCCGIRRELLSLCMPIPAGFKSHDKWLVRFAEGLGGKAVEDKVLQYYRRHESNQSQVFVNKTSKATRVQRYVRTFKNIIRNDAVSDLNKSLEQLYIFAKGVQVVREKSPKKYCKQLTTLSEQTKHEIEKVERLIKLRENWVVMRLSSILRMVFK